MILQMFVMLLCVCAFLMVYGYYSKIRMFSMVGLVILFLLGSWIILYNYTGKDAYGLEYRTGTNITQVDATNTLIEYTYATYSDATAYWVGYLLSLIGIFGMFLVLLNDK